MRSATITRRADDSAASVQAATVWPWYVRLVYTENVQYGAAGDAHTDLPRHRDTWQVVQLPAGQRPDEHAMLPDGAELRRAEMFHAVHFYEFAPNVRLKYREHFANYLLWRRAQAMGKAVTHMVPGLDFDPATMDSDVQRWLAAGSSRHAGGG